MSIQTLCDSGRNQTEFYEPVIPGASMLTEILFDKFEYHMPCYRQIKKFFHQGLEGLTESTVDG